MKNTSEYMLVVGWSIVVGILVGSIVMGVVC